MSTSCENCTRWRNHQFRNCISDKMRFHVVADEGVRICIRIPPEQGSHFRENISDTIKLYAPNGCIYDIGVCREMGEIVLRSGWDVFATAYHIEKNDTLVFKFNGNSSFKVNVFNSHDGSQKTTSCVNPPSEMVETVLPGTSCDYHIPNGKDVPCPGHVQMPAAFDYLTTAGCRLTKAQDEKVLEMSRAFKSEFPLSVAVMGKNNVKKGCFLRIPFKMVKSSREEVFKATIKLEAPDTNIYNVSCIQHSDEIILQSGWNDFVVAHRLQENDLLIFRHKENYRLEVFILDPNGYQKNSSCFVTGNGSDTREMSDDSVEIIDPPHKTVEINDVSSSDDDNNTESTYYIAKSCRGRKQQMDQGQKMTVLRKVKAIRSEFPIFVAVMNKNSVERPFIMRFSPDYATKFLPSTTHALTLQLEGNRSMEWTTVLKAVQGGKKHARDNRIADGWKKFASDNGLRLGDICFFELMPVTRIGELKMIVHLSRKP